jgi:hypothetical protein
MYSIGCAKPVNDDALLTESQAMCVEEMIEKVQYVRDPWQLALGIATYINACGITARSTDASFCGK